MDIIQEKNNLYNGLKSKLYIVVYFQILNIWWVSVCACFQRYIVCKIRKRFVSVFLCAFSGAYVRLFLLCQPKFSSSGKASMTQETYNW